jgi:2-phospho-L-lactate guanylyltransferase
VNALLIPVKDLTRANQRLAGSLSQPQRTKLAEAMLEDVSKAVVAVRGLERVFLLSSYRPALELAEGRGWETIEEAHQISESDSVDFGSRVCEARGVTSLLRLPIDIPLVQPQDIEKLFAMVVNAKVEEGPSVVMVSSRDGTGTNAILRTPPALFPSHFGPGSLAKHREEARRCGAGCRVIRSPRIELDIDDEGDLSAFLAAGTAETATARCLAGFGLRRESAMATKFLDQIAEA